MNHNLFGLRPQDKAKIESVLLQYPYKFYVFGSRSTGKHREYSDLDLLVFGDIKSSEYAQIKTELNDLQITVTIDLISWKYIKDDFKESIKPDLKLFINNIFLNSKVIDLTHTINSNIPSFDDSIINIKEEKSGIFCLNSISMSCGLGTHIDYPAHISGKSGNFSEKDFCAPVYIINSNKIVLEKEDIVDYEDNFGPIAADTWVLINSGWSKLWSDKLKYKNLGSDGKVNSPKISAKAAEYLKNKKIKGLGVDTLSPDGNNYEFPVHQILLKAGIFIVENINFPENFENKFGFLFVSPLKIENITESPTRIYLV